MRRAVTLPEPTIDLEATGAGSPVEQAASRSAAVHAVTATRILTAI